MSAVFEGEAFVGDLRDAMLAAGWTWDQRAQVWRHGEDWVTAAQAQRAVAAAQIGYKWDKTDAMFQEEVANDNPQIGGLVS